MKVLHINTSDRGGAANAGLRLHQGLIEQGVSSKFLVLNLAKRPSENLIQFNFPKEIPDKLISRLYLYYLERRNKKWLQGRSGDYEIFTFPQSAYDITTHPSFQEADIINLHWAADFLSFSSFFKKCKKKVVWTLHDMNPFTGGCHYSGSCIGYQTKCYSCPQLYGTSSDNRAFENLNDKIATFRQHAPDLTIVTPSKWLGQHSKQSALFHQFRHEVIPYGLNEKIFKPFDQQLSRQLLSLPIDKKIILFVADSVVNKRKGFSYLSQAFSLIQNRADVILCAIGNNSDKIQDNNIIELGEIQDERLMALAYAAADVFVIPSLEDNLPNTVLESLMCGTPVIGFPIGGVKEMIINNFNGLVSKELSVEALFEEISRFLGNSDSFNRADIYRDAHGKYRLGIQAEEYINLYNDIFYN
jgi:glycosyltransferase involved in cell wall biosynthesis